MSCADLLLFDIDGTLTRKTGPHHRLALIEGIRHVTGVETSTDGIPVHGMLDIDILALMLQAASLPVRDLPAIIDAAEEYYLANVPDLSEKRCPGVIELLDELTSQGVPLALVTGNVTRIGWKKLERAGLHHYFRFGAFGEMASTRGQLVSMAIARARSEGLIGEIARIAHVGDAPQDVIAAKENGIPVVAVQTGVTDPGELEALRPEHLLQDLTHWPADLFNAPCSSQGLE